MAAVKLVGDWSKAAGITRSMVGAYKRAADQAVLQEAHFLRKKMVEGIREQAPGGKRFKPLAASTLRARRLTGRGGTKALIQSGLLRNSIRVKQHGRNTVFVGVLKTAGGGRANVAEMNEFGKTIAARLTKRSLRFLHAIGADAAATSSGSGVAKRASGGGIGIVIIRIPPRPFVRPVAEKHAKPKDVKARFEKALAIRMGGMLGTA